MPRAKKSLGWPHPAAATPVHSPTTPAPAWYADYSTVRRTQPPAASYDALMSELPTSRPPAWASDGDAVRIPRTPRLPREVL